MPFQNVGGVPHGRPVHPCDIRQEMTEAMSKRHIKILYRKRQTMYCNVIAVKVFGTWLLIAGIYLAAFAAASSIALNFVQDRVITPYAVIVPGLIMPDIDSVQSDCSCLMRLP